MITFSYLLILLFSGALLTFGITKKMAMLERVSLGFGLSLFCISFVYYFLLSANISMTKEVVTVSTLIYFIASYMVGGRRFWNWVKRNCKDIKLSIKGINRWILLLIIFAVFISLFILIEVSFWPISKWDALALYDMRARFFSDGLLFKDLVFLDSFDTFNSGYYFSYPLLTSLIHASIYVINGNMPQIIYPLLFLALILFFYSSLSQFIGNIQALFFSIVLLSVPIYISHAMLPYTNLLYTFYYFSSSVLLARYLTSKTKEKGLLVISGLLLAASVWTRYAEPFYIVNIVLLVYFVIRKKLAFFDIFIFILPVLIIKYFWGSTLQEFTAGGFIMKDVNVGLISKILSPTGFSIASKAAKVFTDFIYENILIFSMLVMVLVSERLVKHVKLVQYIFVANLVLLALGTYVIGVIFVDRLEIFDSIERLGIFIYPFIIYIVASNSAINRIFKRILC